MFKKDLEKAEKPEIKLPTSVGSSKQQEISKKTSTSASLATPKPLTVLITTNCGKFFKRWEYQPRYLPPEKPVCRTRSMSKKHGTTNPLFHVWLELDTEQPISSKLGKEYVKAVYCHHAYLTYMQSTSCKMPGWMKYKLESRLPGEISRTSDTQMTRPLWQKAKN